MIVFAQAAVQKESDARSVFEKVQSTDDAYEELETSLLEAQAETQKQSSAKNASKEALVTAGLELNMNVSEVELEIEKKLLGASVVGTDAMSIDSCIGDFISCEEALKVSPMTRNFLVLENCASMH